MVAQAGSARPANPRASLRGLATLLGVAPGALLAALERAGVRGRRDGRASEADVARVFGDNAARTIFERMEKAGGPQDGDAATPLVASASTPEASGNAAGDTGADTGGPR